MTQKKDGMNYAPKGKPAPVVNPGEFCIAAVALDHGHIYGMCNGLIEAGATLKWVYDPDPQKVNNFLAQYPGTKAASSEEEILADPEVKLVCGAAITSLRCDLGLRVLAAGKDYFTDKAPLTTLKQLEQAKEMVEKTKKKYMVYYSERIHVESAVFAGQLIESGAIGTPIHIDGFGPHRIGDPSSRPDWFFKKDCYGGILCDIGSHQIEQYLYYVASLKGLKKNNPDLLICLCGCMPQEEVTIDLLREKYTQVDIVFGTHNIHKIPEYLYEAYRI